MSDPRGLDMYIHRMDTYESRCPRCETCGLPITDSEMVYNFDGDIVCDDLRCLLGYINRNPGILEDAFEDLKVHKDKVMEEWR